jgi:xanthine/uracil permease
MREIWIPEFITVLFLFLALARPLIPGIGSLAGIFWLPVLAFLIALGMVPAYGFRPEAIPLLVFSAVMAVRYLPHVFALRGLDLEDFSRKRSFLSIIGIVILVLAAVPAFVFAP